METEGIENQQVREIRTLPQPEGPHQVSQHTSQDLKIPFGYLAWKVFITLLQQTRIPVLALNTKYISAQR
jgi:hypothetical protein